MNGTNHHVPVVLCYFGQGIYNNNIIITFIYTAQIQLYSFQMRLTIKDLKIYRKKNIFQVYSILQTIKYLLHTRRFQPEEIQIPQKIIM